MESEDPKPLDEGLSLALAIVGVGLMLAPRLVGFGETLAIWHACIVGVALALLAAASLVVIYRPAVWAAMAVALWAIAAPWVLDFAADGAATRPHVVAGIVAVLVVALQLWAVHRRRPHPEEERRYRRVRAR
ncbi:MAG: SPW repeat protein [Gemmatimonas sp.]